MPFYFHWLPQEPVWETWTGHLSGRQDESPTLWLRLHYVQM